MAESSLVAEVVAINPRKHSNADNLSIVDIYGFTCVINTEQWSGVKKGVYIPPDTIVNIKFPEFTFLADKADKQGKVRIKAKKIRGELSFGLLVPVSDDANLGDNYWGKFELEHYEPESKIDSKGAGQAASAPNVYHVKYDVENGRRYASQLFSEGEPVWVTEKIHGENWRCVFHEKMYVGSRTLWKKEYCDVSHIDKAELIAKLGEEKGEEVYRKILEKNAQQIKNRSWQGLDNCPQIAEFCKAYPDHVVYGELYGLQKGFMYDCTDKLKVRVFDILANGKWLDYEELLKITKPFDVPIVPFINQNSFNFEELCKLAEGNTLLGGKHIREGIVVRSCKERSHPKYGRSVLKFVSAAYLEKN